MNNKVYYGEYSLKHWINLVLKKNIVLPDYQRFFVWNENKVETLIETIKKKQFVPPVTIGAFKLDESNKNLILDGQQRITSIVLAYLGLYPDEHTYKNLVEAFANDNDDTEEEPQFDNILEWNINKLTEKGKDKQKILDSILQGNYKSINLNLDETFFETHFLGFSYLVPQNSNENEQQKYYSSVFRNINIQGEPLLPQESRASLYFLDQDLVQLFSPDFFKNIIIKLIKNKAKADFVRYLSMLSQYHHNSSDTSRVARGYKQKMEKFYEEYIYASINDINSNIYGKFSSIFPNKEYSEDLTNLENTLNELDLFKEYPSIVDVDTYLFGLVYIIIFKKKKIDITKKEALTNKLNKKISVFKGNLSHQKSPNNLGHLRNRLSQSITIYEEYIINES
jgi:uncharacterized protein with ParB-like and HNH nuclease domain